MSAGGSYKTDQEKIADRELTAKANGTNQYPGHKKAPCKGLFLWAFMVATTRLELVTSAL